MIRTVIADDDPDLRSLFSLVVGGDNRFEVVGTAGTGREAIALIESEKPDLVLVDLAMPDMDGLEVLEHIDPGARPAAIVLSGFSSQNVIDGAMQRGAVGYITKGLAIRTIPDRIVEILDGVGLKGSD